MVDFLWNVKNRRFFAVGSTLKYTLPLSHSQSTLSRNGKLFQVLVNMGQTRCHLNALDVSYLLGATKITFRFFLSPKFSVHFASFVLARKRAVF